MITSNVFLRLQPSFCSKDAIFCFSSGCWVLQSLMNKLRVVQFEGLAPSVFCGMYFADQGAEVIVVARSESAPVAMPIHKNIMNRNKKCISINLKDKQHFQIVKTLITHADIIIDPYRPGVLQKLKLGPSDLYEINRKAILLRVSGYGQTGPSALRPGHDLNYLSVSGIIPLINKSGENQFPSNYLADFVSASLGITGTLAALAQREQTGIGKVVDCSLANGCTYLAQHLLKSEKVEPKVAKELHDEGQSYVYSTKNGQTLSKEQLVKLLKGNSYYRSENGDAEVSLVKGIDPFEGNSLKNPFSSTQLSNRIKTKGEDDAQIFGKLRAKL